METFLFATEKIKYPHPQLFAESKEKFPEGDRQSNAEEEGNVRIGHGEEIVSVDHTVERTLRYPSKKRVYRYGGLRIRHFDQARGY